MKRLSTWFVSFSGYPLYQRLVIMLINLRIDVSFIATYGVSGPRAFVAKCWELSQSSFLLLLVFRMFEEFLKRQTADVGISFCSSRMHWGRNVSGHLSVSELFPWASLDWSEILVLDTWGKFQHNVLIGNTVNFGDYDRCIGFSHVTAISTVQTIKGRHCMVSFTSNNLTSDEINLNLGWRELWVTQFAIFSRSYFTPITEFC